MKHFLLLIFSSFSIHSIAQTGVDYLDWIHIDFEDPDFYEYILINPDDSLNIWNIGNTAKFNSDTLGLFTDTNLTYANNVHSWFQIQLNNHIQGGPTTIEMNYELSTQNGDGLYIEVSYDNGNSFENVIYDTIPGQWQGSYNPYFSFNLYNESDTLFNAEPGFSGETIQNLWLQWQDLCLGQGRNFTDADTAIVRFNFISDSIPSNHTGIIISNLEIIIPVCSSINELESNQFELIQNPTHDFIEMRSLETTFSNYSYEIYNLTGRLIESNSGLYESVFRIDMKSHANGSYFLLILDEDNGIVSRHKVIKN